MSLIYNGLQDNYENIVVYGALEISFNGYVQIFISDLKTRKSSQVHTTGRNFKEKKINQTMNDLDGPDEM